MAWALTSLPTRVWAVTFSTWSLPMEQLEKSTGKKLSHWTLCLSSLPRVNFEFINVYQQFLHLVISVEGLLLGWHKHNTLCPSLSSLRQESNFLHTWFTLMPRIVWNLRNTLKTHPTIPRGLHSLHIFFTLSRISCLKARRILTSHTSLWSHNRAGKRYVPRGALVVRRSTAMSALHSVFQEVPPRGQVLWSWCAENHPLRCGDASARACGTCAQHQLCCCWINKIGKWILNSVYAVEPLFQDHPKSKPDM